jgi:tetratricopeptide (TPR) repeat protein
VIALLYFNAAESIEVLSQETFRDIIRKAELLALQKDRTQSTQILISAIKKEEKQNANRLELQKTLDQISSIFFTDNAQQVYETGVLLKEKDPVGAVEKLNEALRLDPKNFLVYLTLAKIYLAQFDCGKSKSQLEAAQAVNPYNSELDILLVYQTMCYKKPIVSTIFKKNNQKNSPYQLNWLTLEITNFFNTPNFDTIKIKELISNLQKIDPNYPEIYYYLFLVDGLRTQNGKLSGERYIKNCKDLNFKKDKIYGSEPWLCVRITEVEQALQSKGNSE